MIEKKSSNSIKRLHPRNKNVDRYDLEALKKIEPELKNYLKITPLEGETFDFSQPQAVKLLNKALLPYYYEVDYWDFSDKHLCPPIPCRADYVHYIADLLSESCDSSIPTGPTIKGLDIGTGGTCIYPILGATEYNWDFVGVDVHLPSLESAQNIVNKNPKLQDKITCRLQKDPQHIYIGVINPEDKFAFSMCNPPFHANEEEAAQSNRRKVRNLTGKNKKKIELNFSGLHNELIYEGGEIAFISKMIEESFLFQKQCVWFTTLVSNENNLKTIEKLLKHHEVQTSRIIPMGTTNKITRIMAWSYYSAEEQKKWFNER